MIACARFFLKIELNSSFCEHDMMQVPVVEPLSRRNSFSEEIKSQLSSRRSSASSAASTSRRQSGSSLIMSRRGSYSVVREEVEEREVESPKGVPDLEMTLRHKLEEQNKVRLSGGQRKSDQPRQQPPIWAFGKLWKGLGAPNWGEQKIVLPKLD